MVSHCSTNTNPQIISSTSLYLAEPRLSLSAPKDVLQMLFTTYRSIRRTGSATTESCWSSLEDQHVCSAFYRALVQPLLCNGSMCSPDDWGRQWTWRLKIPLESKYCHFASYGAAVIPRPARMVRDLIWKSLREEKTALWDTTKSLTTLGSERMTKRWFPRQNEYIGPCNLGYNLGSIAFGSSTVP